MLIKKTLAIAALFLVTSASSFAQTTRSAERGFAKCVQKVGLSNQNNGESLTELSQLLKQFAAANSAEEINPITANCEKLLIAIQAYPKILTRAARGQIFDTFTATEPLPSALQRNMQMLYMPNMSCTTVSVQADLVLGVGGSVGLGAGACKLSNGRTFLAFAPEAGYGTGGLVAVTFDFNTIAGLVPEDVATVTGNDQAEVGIIVAISIPDNYDNHSQNKGGAGFGIGLARDRQETVILKTFQISRGLNGLITNLKTSY